MRFKVNNKYIIDAKSRDDAIRVVKMLDAMETYSIRWIDTYAKSKGYGPDFWRYNTEIKANNVKEALETLAKHVALGGTGTANCLVMHVSNSHATYQFSGRLSDLLKKTKEQLGDSVKDANYQLRYNNGAAADMSYLKLVKETPTQLVFKNLLYTHKDEQFIYVDKKTKVATYNSGEKIGTMADAVEKTGDSVKDGKYVSELKPGDVITKKDGSKWDVVLVRYTPFGIQVRMNSKTSPVKTEEITYRPTDMLVYDSVKDSVTVRDIIQSLVTEETSAISSYNVALETLKDHIPDEAYEAIKAIRDDEQRHVENLYAVLNGNVTPKNLEN